MQKAMAADIPLMGLCLGCQLLAVAIGGTGFRAPSSELGFTADFPVSLTTVGLSHPVACTLLPPPLPVDPITAKHNARTDLDPEIYMWVDGTDEAVNPAQIDGNLLLFHSDTFTLPAVALFPPHYPAQYPPTL